MIQSHCVPIVLTIEECYYKVWIDQYVNIQKGLFNEVNAKPNKKKRSRLHAISDKCTL